MHVIYLLIIFAVTVLRTFSVSMNMVTIPGTPVMCRAPTSYSRATTTASACSDHTDRTTGTCNGSPKPYMPSFPSSTIKIHSFDWDKLRYSEWLRFRTEFDSIFDTPTYSSLTAKDQIVLIVHWLDREMQKLYYSSPESECDAMEPDIQHFLDHINEVWRPIRATLLERVSFTNMNRSQDQTGDDYMSQQFKESFASLLTYCRLFSQSVQFIMDTKYPCM